MKASHFLSIIASFIIATAISAQDATALYDEGMKLKKEKKTAEAIKKFEQAIALKSDYWDAYYDMGWCQNDLKNYTGALASLRKARAAWVPTARVYFELGWAFEKLAMYDSAVASYKQCQGVNPGYSSVPRQLGYIAYARDNYAEALEHFVKYESLAKDSITDYLYWYRKGFSNDALKKYDEAIAALEKSMRYKADYINTYLELGFAHTRMKRNDIAIAMFTKAMEIDPKSHVPLNGIAEVYRDNKKDINEAMNWYKKSLAVVPNERKACFGMGYCLNSQGKYADAISYLKTAIEKEPDYTAAFVEIGYSYYMTGNNADAITNLTKAMTLNPANENSRYYLTLVYINKKEKANAQRIVDELKKLNSKHVEKLQPKVDAL